MSEIALKFLDILLGGLLERRREKRALASKFEVLKARILAPGLVNDLPVGLAELRDFIVQNGLMGSPGFTH